MKEVEGMKALSTAFAVRVYFTCESYGLFFLLLLLMLEWETVSMVVRFWCIAFQGWSGLLIGLLVA